MDLIFEFNGVQDVRIVAEGDVLRVCFMFLAFALDYDVCVNLFSFAFSFNQPSPLDSPALLYQSHFTVVDEFYSTVERSLKVFGKSYSGVK